MHDGPAAFDRIGSKIGPGFATCGADLPAMPVGEAMAAGAVRPRRSKAARRQAFGAAPLAIRASNSLASISEPTERSSEERDRPEYS